MTALWLGSLFDGIGVFPLAAVRCGIEPIWASEIEKAPIWLTVSKSLADRQPQGTCGRKVQPVFSSHPHYP